MTHAAAAKLHALRLGPGEDVRLALERLSIPAAGIVSAVGSLTRARIRLAGATQIRELGGPLEIVALSGTLGAGGAHLHALCCDPCGTPVGGHVCEGCVVHTTLELMLIEAEGLRFDRVHDARTGYAELTVREA